MTTYHWTSADNFPPILDKKIILHIGRLIDRKGVSEIIEAFKILSSKRNDLILLQTKEDNTDTFGPLTEKEQERLRDLLLKEKED